jgi:hypothetical protein
MGNQVLKGWNRACTSVGSTVGSLPEYVASQSLTESEKREQKKLDAEDKMIRSAIQYLEIVAKSDTQELAAMENKESAECVEINSRLAENMNILKQKKIRLAEVAVRMEQVRNKSMTQAADNVVTTTKDVTNTVVEVSSNVATKTVSVTKSVGSAIGSGVKATVITVKQFPQEVNNFVDDMDTENEKKTSKNKIIEKKTSAETQEVAETGMY